MHFDAWVDGDLSRIEEEDNPSTRDEPIACGVTSKKKESARKYLILLCPCEDTVELLCLLVSTNFGFGPGWFWRNIRTKKNPTILCEWGDIKGVERKRDA